MSLFTRWVAAGLLALSLPAWGLDAETQAAKDEGMRLYGIYHRSKAVPYLEQAASAGDVESMYTLGEIDRLRHMGLTKVALDWYLKAAEHGDPHAMLRLYKGGACELGDYCPSDADGWREKALAEQLPKAKAGDTQAMVALYSIYVLLDEKGTGEDWLEKAAEAGNPHAQDWLGRKIKDGLGFYFTDSGRLETAEKWVRKAAEQGYVPAMNTLSALMSKQGKNQEAWEWIVHASEGGHMNGRQWLGLCHLTPQYDELCQTQQNVIKGWAILYAVAEETNSSTAKEFMADNRDRLTPEQRQEAETLAEAEWIGHGPPLSNFPPKYGF